MHPRTAAQTPQPASARRAGMDRSTAATGARRVAFVEVFDADPQRLRLLRQIADELPMGPLADLLVGRLPQAHPCLDVAHLPHRHGGHALCLAERHRLARRRVQDLALLAIELGTDRGFAPTE